MRKSMFILLVAALCMNHMAYADKLDADTIFRIHMEVRNKFVEKCKENVEGATDRICNCLADKAVTSLDDKVLAKCENDATGGACITGAVSDAAKKALTKESVKFCNPTLSKTSDLK